ncbi:baeRF6 domain-containing protein [Lacticaseibacillus hegangensis]|uniref:Bacterial archaeo-eukaryotic release factor family 6 domain-containing protein n=1 Tax=Lacticaseibacillus hegangensis TaxID=2486010 RepID=A0ABW4CUV2_9LACO|nr:hypothetical protein [Lacticaseibacillus hegangensis]
MATDTQLSLQDFLSSSTKGPFVSLYLPLEADRTVEATRLTLRHLAAHAKDVMAQTHPGTDFAPYEATLKAAAGDQPLISIVGQGAALLSNGQQAIAVGLEYAVSPTAMTTDRPQLLPLVLDAQRQFDFDLLLLQRDKVALALNRGDVLTMVDLPDDAPVTLLGTLGTEKRGGSVNTVAQGPGQASYHGHADRASEEEIDRRRYYQAVDTYLLDHYSNPNQRRLILFGLPENIAAFREISRNPHLSGSMQVELNPGNMSLGDIDLALDDLRQDYADRHADETLALLETARGSGKYVEDLGGIIEALQQRSVDTLVLRQGARIRGVLEDGRLETDGPAAEHNNLLNDLAAMTLAQGGKVQVVPDNLLRLRVAAVRRYREA